MSRATAPGAARLSDRWHLVRGADLAPHLKFMLRILMQFQGSHDKCWPSQDLLAIEAGMTGRGVRKLLSSLSDHNVLTLGWASGTRGKRRTYQIKFDQLIKLQHPEYRNSGSTIPLETRNGGSAIPDETWNCGSGQTRNCGSADTGTVVPTEESLKSHTEESLNVRSDRGVLFKVDTSESDTHRTPSGERQDWPVSSADGSGNLPAAFDRFYDAYGKKLQPKRARTAFEKAVRSVMAERHLSRPDAEALITARAAEYRATFEGRDRTFQPNPATWLNAGSFDEDPDDWRRAQQADLARCNGTQVLSPDAESALKALSKALRQFDAGYEQDALRTAVGDAVFNAARQVGFVKLKAGDRDACREFASLFEKGAA